MAGRQDGQNKLQPGLVWPPPCTRYTLPTTTRYFTDPDHIENYFSQETLWAKCFMLSSTKVGAITVASILAFRNLEYSDYRKSPSIRKSHLKRSWSALNSFFSLALKTTLSSSGEMKGFRQA